MIGLPRSLRAQLTLSAALLVAVAVAGSGLAIALRIDSQDRSQIDRQLDERATKVLTDVGKSGDGRTIFSEADKPGDTSEAGRANLLAGSGSLTRVMSGETVLAERGERITGVVPLPDDDGFSTIEIGAQSWRSFVVSLPPGKGQRLQVLQNLAPVEQRLRTNKWITATVTIIATLIAALATWVIAGIVIAPLERLRAAASSIRPGAETGQHLPQLRRPTEVAELSATLDGMLNRLLLSMQATRRFTADSGHELRTPLTSLGMDIETLRRNPALPAARREEMLLAITIEHQRIVRLLDGLQQLARGDAGALPAREHVDLAELAMLAIDAARRRHPSITFRFEHDADDPAAITGWPDGLRIMLDNLLDNAANHGKPAGTVDISLTRTLDGIALAVSDDGPGIPPDERDRMTQRFTRGVAPRSAGSGLGLALVDQQARLHGGALELDTSPAGGLQATVTLTVASPSPPARS
jgi:two-component system sensor histidine kinase PrrB